jgi:NAD(P)H-flavin reductase
MAVAISSGPGPGEGSQEVRGDGNAEAVRGKQEIPVPGEEAAPEAGIDQDSDPLGDLLAAVDPVSDLAMTYFYGHLFAIEPQARAMFPPAMDAQRIRFYRALSHIISGGGNAAGLASYLEELGRAHRKFGVQKEHYDAFRQALAATWHRYAPDAWTDAAAGAWDDMFGSAIGIMIGAAERDAERAPPWWLAEITGHELRAADLAVLTLQPSQPVHYLPGQHMSVQTPRWPRLWRNYSIANAPREDGTLTIHVRAVPGGLVSAALVHHMTVGDTLLLGAPSGSMTAEVASERDVLCLAGGTGLAPVKAIIEAMIRTRGTGHRREIVLYHGVRRGSAFYDMPDLEQMEMTYPWLQVIPVVSEETARDTIHGSIPDVVARASWKDRDIYVSGPDEMTAKAVSELKSRGAPEALIHYDCPLFLAGPAAFRPARRAASQTLRQPGTQAPSRIS